MSKNYDIKGQVRGDAVVAKWVSNKWLTINQRTVNGQYANSPSVRNNPQQRSYLAKGIRLEMTKEEFISYCSDNYDKIRSMMDAGERPSIDRVCDDCPYSIDNIHIIPLIDNLTKDKQASNRKKVSKLAYTIINRKQYILHNNQDHKVLGIDKYLIGNKIKDIVEAVELGLIRQPFELDNEANYDEAPNRFFAKKKAEVDEKKACKIRKARELVAKKEMIETNKANSLPNLKKKYKSHPEWENMLNLCKDRYKATALYGIDVTDLTPTRAAIEILQMLEKK